MTSYHGWTHRPKEDGGTDPIPGRGVTVFRAAKYLAADDTTVTTSHVALDWVWWENGDPTIFEPRKTNNDASPVIGTDKARYIRLLKPGRYIHTVQFQFQATITDHYTIALNDNPEDPTWGLREAHVGSPHPVGDWMSFTNARVYPEVDLFDSPPSHWPDFPGGGFVGSYWTIAKETNTSTLRRARMEIQYDPGIVIPEPPASVPS